MRQTVKIVMYHYVRNLEESRYPAIHGLSTHKFIQQLDFIQSNFTIVSIQDIIDAFYDNKILPEDACLLTFDDGYKDHYDTVFPILMSRGLRAFFSMPGRILREGKLLDVNKIHYIMANADPQLLWRKFQLKMKDMLKEHDLPSFDTYWNACSLESRFDSPEVIFMKRMLQVELPDIVRNALLNQLYREFVDVPEHVMVQELYMSMEQMKLMRSCGMHFGIHGYEHAWLNKMTKDDVRRDIQLALETMDGLVNQEGWVMCYPYGSYSDMVCDICREYGAVLGLATNARTADLDKDNKMALPRLDTNDFPPITSNYISI